MLSLFSIHKPHRVNTPESDFFVTSKDAEPIKDQDFTADNAAHETPLSASKHVATDSDCTDAARQGWAGISQMHPAHVGQSSKEPYRTQGNREQHSLWPSKSGRARLFLGHGGNCECCLKPLPMQQSLDEMEWERGIWGLSSNGLCERSAMN
jgi:hypothetical protein